MAEHNYTFRTLSELEDLASDRGADLVTPAPYNNLLLLDIDKVISPQAWKEDNEDLLQLLDQFFGIVEIHTWESGGGNLHIRIRLESSVSPEMSTALQAILGSDPFRELLSCAERSQLRENVLFRPLSSPISNLPFSRKED